MLAWRHGGFSAHNDVRVAAEDAEGRKTLAGYMLRAPMSLQKMTYDAATGTVIYRSKMHAGLKRPGHAGRRVVGVALQTRSRPLRAPGALRGVVLEPRPGRAREESLASGGRYPAVTGRGGKGKVVALRQFRSSGIHPWLAVMFVIQILSRT
jgi:hypothetical protein